jgi:integration host factor subunit alpha
MPKTITRADLGDAVYQTVGLSRNESAKLVEQVLDELVDALIRGESVKLSSFGSFMVRKKGQRIGRNPKTGQEVPILPRRVLVFRASNLLKAHLNKPTSSPAASAETAQ